MVNVAEFLKITMSKFVHTAINAKPKSSIQYLPIVFLHAASTLKKCITIASASIAKLHIASKQVML